MEEEKEVVLPVDKGILSAWMDSNSMFYTEFKDFLETIMFEPDSKELIEYYEEDAEFMLFCIGALGSLAKGFSTLEDWYELAVNDKEDFAYAICCYLCFDNGLGQIKRGIDNSMKFYQNIGLAEGINSLKKQWEDDSKKETSITEGKELNLLTLRRWHYDHPLEYAEFLDSVEKAYGGDMAFATKGFNYLIEMLSLSGISKVIELISDYIPGTERYIKRLTSSGYSSFHDRLKEILEASLNNEVTKNRLLRNNPHFNSTLYWLVFDNGFIKAADLISKTLMSEGNMEFMKVFGGEAVLSLLQTGSAKAKCTKKSLENFVKGMRNKYITSTLMDVTGRRGRNDVCLLFEEMLCSEYRGLIIKAVDDIVAEERQFNDTDSIFAYIFVALNKCGLLNDTYSYRCYHDALNEKYPHYEIKKGYDHAEALYHAIMNPNNCNTNITEKQIKYGKNQVRNIEIRIRMLMSPDIIP